MPYEPSNQPTDEELAEQLAAYGTTLQHQSAESLRPDDNLFRLDGRPEPKRWFAVIGAVAATIVGVVGLAALTTGDDATAPAAEPTAADAAPGTESTGPVEPAVGTERPPAGRTPLTEPPHNDNMSVGAVSENPLSLSEPDYSSEGGRSFAAFGDLSVLGVREAWHGPNTVETFGFVVDRPQQDEIVASVDAIADESEAAQRFEVLGAITVQGFTARIDGDGYLLMTARQAGNPELFIVQAKGDMLDQPAVDDLIGRITAHFERSGYPTSNSSPPPTTVARSGGAEQPPLAIELYDVLAEQFDNVTISQPRAHALEQPWCDLPANSIASSERRLTVSDGSMSGVVSVYEFGEGIDLEALFTVPDSCSSTAPDQVGGKRPEQRLFGSFNDDPDDAFILVASIGEPMGTTAYYIEIDPAVATAEPDLAQQLFDLAQHVVQSHGAR